MPTGNGSFNTIAGFMLSQLSHLPEVGDQFAYEGWRFEVVNLDGRRIDKILATRRKSPLIRRLSRRSSAVKCAA